MNWSDITIEKFQKINNVRNGVYEFDVEKEIAFISAVTGISTEELEAMPYKELLELGKKCKFAGEPIRERLKKRVRIGAKFYEFELKAQNITAQQYILINRYTVNEGNVVENMHYLMAALSYEVDLLGRRKAWDYNYEAKAQTFLKQMPYDIANTIMVFFCKVYAAWSEATKDFLHKQTMQATREVVKQMVEMNLLHSDRIGDGLQR